MSAIYDNWERLVAATIKRQELWELFHSDSISTRASSIASADLLSPFTQIPNLPYPSSSSTWYHQNPIPEDGVYRWGYSADDPEVKKGVNKAEKKSIEVRKLIPEDIVVNGKPLSRKELVLLQSSLNPPKDLKPGEYWYDRHAGFWGKLGQKPSQIISSNLYLGDQLRRDASNGSTDIYVNGREITRAELRLLKFAGVECHKGSGLWMYDDGTYEEEGMNRVKGRLWTKAGVKLFCSLLSLPYPPKSSHNTSGEVSMSEHLEQRPIQKLLLVGPEGSGTSTFFKQALFLYKDVPFLKGELEHIRLIIQSNLYRYICLLLEGHKQFEEILRLSETNEYAGEDTPSADAFSGNEKNVYSLNPRLEAISEWLLEVMASKNLDIFDASFIQTSSPLVEELLDFSALQHTLMRRTELENISFAANYFLERAVHIFRPDYKPSQKDILHAEEFPPSPSYTIFTIQPRDEDLNNDGYQQDSLIRYQLIRSTSFSDDADEDENLLYIYEDVRIVIFCISLTDYDQFVLDDYGESVNKMIFNREYLKRVVTLSMFNNQCEVLLLLTKYDLFEEKIQHIPLNQCAWFGDYNTDRQPLKITNNMGETGFHYISSKFKRFFAEETSQKLYVARVNCLDPDNIDAALRYAGEILKWSEEKSEYDYWSEFDTDDDVNYI